MVDDRVRLKCYNVCRGDPRGDNGVTEVPIYTPFGVQRQIFHFLGETDTEQRQYILHNTVLDTAILIVKSPDRAVNVMWCPKCQPGIFHLLHMIDGWKFDSYCVLSRNHSHYATLVGCTFNTFTLLCAKVQTMCFFLFLVQVRLGTEVLRTPSSTRPGFELMTSRSWQYTWCHWGACSNHSVSSDFQHKQLYFWIKHGLGQKYYAPQVWPTSCHWDACSNHTAISDFHQKELYLIFINNT